MELDVQGTWIIETPEGESCQLALQTYSPTPVDLHWRCLEVGGVVHELRGFTVDEDSQNLDLTDADGAVRLSFSTSNLDRLDGEGAASGYHLRRLGISTAGFRWEGYWRIYGDGIRFHSPCKLFFMMRRRDLKNGFAYVPSGVSLSSRCTEPLAWDDDEGAPADSGHILPQWVNWDILGDAVLLRSSDDSVTVFRRDWENDYTAEVRTSHEESFIMRLDHR